MIVNTLLEAMRRLTRAHLLVLAFASAAAAQNRSASDPETVFLDVTALDSAGRFVPGLSASDFSITRGGSAMKISKFEANHNPLSGSMVMLVDDLGMPFDRLRDLRAALREFVSGELRPRDRIAILRTSAGAGHLERLTNDPALLSAAINQLQYSPLGETAPNQPHSFTSGTLLQLRLVLDGLRNMPGRKAVVLFSERTGLARNAAADLESDVERSTMRIAELAHQGMASLYVVQAVPPTSQPDTGLAAAVKQTGGTWIGQSAGYAEALAQVSREQEGHYLLGFQPGTHAYDYFSGRDRFPDIVAKAIRPDVSLRARTVVYGAPDNEPTDFDAAFRVPGAGDIAIHATPRFFVSDTGPMMDVLLHVDARSLTFVRTLSGEYRCALEVWAAGLDALAFTRLEDSRTGMVTLTEAGYRATLETGILTSLRIPVKNPGVYQFRSAVRDDATGRIGSASQYLEVPDLSKGALALSGIHLAVGDTAGEVRQSTALRVFKPGQRIAYEYQIYNARPGGEVHARVFRDSQEIFAGQVTRIGDTPAGSLGRLLKGSLLLSSEMAAGRYRFQVFASDKAGDQPRTATGFIDFEVRR